MGDDQSVLAQLKGRTVVDRATDRTGVVMDVICGIAYLRPPGGGIEWERAARHLTELAEKEAPGGE